MSEESWTVLATLVIAVATVVYMAVSIFQGRMMLKSFRLSALQALKDFITPKGSDVGGAFTTFMFYRLYQQIFPSDYKKVQEAIADAKIDRNQFFNTYMNLAMEAQRICREFQNQAFSHLQDPFLGMCADEPELMDQITESAMQAREQHQLRQGGG